MNVYTDGSAIGTAYNQSGGWGFAVIDKGKVVFTKKDGVHPSTNNIMELTAIKEAILYIKNLKDERPYGKDYTIYTDSQYSINSLTVWYKIWKRNGWKNAKKEPVKNKELIQEILSLLEELPYIKLEKVKGHSNNEYNILADKLATEASKEIERDYLFGGKINEQ